MSSESETDSGTSTDTSKDDDSPFDGVRFVEGRAKIELPREVTEQVFYNPVQEYNRDLSIAAIQNFMNLVVREDLDKKSFTILEALSATGLRSIRYAKELEPKGPEDTEVSMKIYANDRSSKAYESIKTNIVKNGVESVVFPSMSDAMDIMYKHRYKEDRYDIIDLDPYGSPTIFLDGAVQSVTEGGLLCVTCTDMAVLAGNAPETCYTKYGSISLKSKGCHEMALRIVLQCIESHANRYSRYIVPLLSLSIDFYVRIFVRVYTSQKICKQTTSKIGHVFQCLGCESQTTVPLGLVITEKGNMKYKLPNGPPVGTSCNFCGHGFKMGGPFWLAPIHDRSFIGNILNFLEFDGDAFGTHARMKGMLTVAGEELVDTPFYYQLDRLCSMIKAGTGKFEIFSSAILNAGFNVSISHANSRALKTNAPNSVIWKIMKAYKKKYFPSAEECPSDSVAFKLLHCHDDSIYDEISFDLHKDANPKSRSSNLLRFQENPLPNWGPKMKAHVKTDAMVMKRKHNQGRHANKKSKTEDESDHSDVTD